MGKLILVAMLMSSVASADTSYFIKGKAVTRAEAIRAAIGDENLEILKVSVNFTKINMSTARLNKSRAATVKDIPR